MKYLLLSLTGILFYSCKSNTQNSAQSFLDSLNEAKRIDSIFKDRIKEVYLSDTLRITEAPVQVISARVTPYGNIKLEYKNVSNKTVSAIKFAWYGIDAFYDPVDLGSYPVGAGGGYIDDILSTGSERESEWHSNNDKLKSIVKAWPTEVAFEDGTKWKIK